MKGNKQYHGKTGWQQDSQQDVLRLKGKTKKTKKDFMNVKTLPTNETEIKANSTEWAKFLILCASKTSKLYKLESTY